MKVFAHKTLPPLLKMQTNHYESVVNQVTHTLRQLVDAAEAVAFLVDRVEQEPAWFKQNNQDGWSRHGSQLAQWRSEAKGLPPKLESRLLRVVLAELSQDLRTMRQRNRTMFQANTSYYWQEMERGFARTAEVVYAERKHSGDAVKYVAEYFYRGCNRPDRAIEIMFDAHARKLLDDNGQGQLVLYLHGRDRFEESIGLLIPLVARSPDALGSRTLLYRVPPDQPAARAGGGVCGSREALPPQGPLGRGADVRPGPQHRRVQALPAGGGDLRRGADPTASADAAEPGHRQRHPVAVLPASPPPTRSSARRPRRSKPRAGRS